MIAPESPSEELRVLAAIDAAFAEAREKAGDWITCHAGCDQCCRRPFAITAQDARRLREGFATLHPATQTDIQERAAQARRQIADDFPGNLDTGTLTDDPEWREWFFTRHDGLPCPVLNLETGECRLYAHRPVACRLAGPLIQIGASLTDPCPLCFPNVSRTDVNTTLVKIEIEQFKDHSESSETLIALSLFK